MSGCTEMEKLMVDSGLSIQDFVFLILILVVELHFYTRNLLLQSHNRNAALQLETLYQYGC
ncbi:CLUMA_CG016937, isoform A [Clunio marinus]|uniref:CLUMA_CG016937, isoform A n=1 Tax=Clunio marinus TaxID=568069 RepID=A0A1J1IX05_9DIPT|nr:CLUMA_CG016937, isoform A [Clunio marinus]